MQDDTILAFHPPAPEPELLDRYLAGECSAAEAARIQAWAGISASGTSYVDEVRDAYRTIGARTVDAEGYVRTLAQRCGLSGGPRAHDHAKGAVFAASAVGQPSRGMRRKGGVGRETLRTGIISAVGFAVFVGALLHERVIDWSHQRSESRPRATYVTRTGQQGVVTLIDGTRVHLAPQTTLQVALNFGAASRTVSLLGEAYFEVPRSTGVPFIVRTAIAETRVLGTTFDVKHYTTDATARVAVASGRVVVTGTLHARVPVVTLTTGMTGVICDSTAVIANDSTNAAGWMSGWIIFREAPTIEVLAALTRWYGYRFAFTDSSLIRQNLTLGLSTESSAAALATLEQLLDVNITISGNTVTLRPKRSSLARPNRSHEWHNETTVHSIEVGR